MGESYEERFMREVQQLEPQRNRRPPRRFDDEQCYAMSLTSDIDEPNSINEAWKGEYSTQWKEATNAEYQSLMDNST